MVSVFRHTFVCIGKRKETLDCDQCLSLADGNTSEFYFLLEMVWYFPLCLRKWEFNFIFRKNIKNERKTEMCLECIHSVGNINIWQFGGGLVRANLENTTVISRHTPRLCWGFSPSAVPYPPNALALWELKKTNKWRKTKEQKQPQVISEGEGFCGQPITIAIIYWALLLCQPMSYGLYVLPLTIPHSTPLE